MLTAANAITNLDIHAGELGNQISQVNSGGFPTDSGPRCVKVGHVKTQIRLHSDAGITHEPKKRLLGEYLRNTVIPWALLTLTFPTVQGQL